MRSPATELLEAIADMAARGNPFPLYRRLCGLGLVEQTDGSFLACDYDLVTALLNDSRLSSSVPERAHTSSATVDLPFIRLDPPEHTRMRQHLNRALGCPGRNNVVSLIEPQLRQTIDDLCRALPAPGSFDLVQAVTSPFALKAVMRVLGLPQRDDALGQTLSDTLARGLDLTNVAAPSHLQVGEMDKVQNAFREFDELVSKRLTDGSIAQMSVLARLDEDAGSGGPSRGEILSVARILLVAGHETASSFLANAVVHLLSRREVWNSLRERDAPVTQVVEELLRFDPAVHLVQNRTALADITTTHGTIPRGRSVVLVLAGANRDPTAFADPDSFDALRPRSRHLGFGDGIHRCIGARLARAEAKVALVTMATRFVEPEIDGEIEWRYGYGNRGPAIIPVRIAGLKTG